MKIHLQQIRLHAYHGCLEQERVVGNDYEIDLTLDVPPTDTALLADDLGGTVNYAEVADIVKEEMAKPSQLIEHVATLIACRLLRELSRIETAEITVRKLAPPMAVPCRAAAVTLKMSREDLWMVLRKMQQQESQQ